MRCWLLVLVASCGRVGFDTVAQSPGGELDGGGGTLADSGAAGHMGGGTNPVPCADRTITDVTLGGNMNLTGTLGTTGPNAMGTCGGTDAEDIYRVTIDGNDGALLLTAGSSTADVVMYVRSDCDEPSSEIACAVGKTDGSAVLYFGPLTAGTYYLFVDGDAPGSYEISTESLLGGHSACSFAQDCGLGWSCTDTTENEKCLGAGPGECTIAQAFTGAGPFSATANNTSPGSFHAAQLGADDGGWYSPETVYTIALAASVSDLEVSTIATSTNYDTLLYVETSCDGQVVGWNDDAPGHVAGASDLHTGPLAAGTYYVFVDGYFGAMGTAGLSIDVTP
jgi:hypothetical protein